jgi:hypothetical protein
VVVEVFGTDEAVTAGAVAAVVTGGRAIGSVVGEEIVVVDRSGGASTLTEVERLPPSRANGTATATDTAATATAARDARRRLRRRAARRRTSARR